VGASSQSEITYELVSILKLLGLASVSNHDSHRKMESQCCCIAMNLKNSTCNCESHVFYSRTMCVRRWGLRCARVCCKTEAVARRTRDGQALKVDIVEGTWSSGMILASGARGREFDSRSAPCSY
jgi:hypothetical protein